MSKRQYSKKKFTFSLKISKLSEIHTKYNIGPVNNTTIIKEENVGELQYHDELRKLHKCSTSSIDFSKAKTYHCFWDRNPFTHTPFSCPIEYNPRIISKVYNSEISKDKFVVNETIPKSLDFDNPQISISKRHEHYESDGIFCSMNCALAFAIDNKLNPLYSKSETMIRRIHQELSPDCKTTLITAPSWRLLKEYGGLQTIEEFRKNFQRVSYESKGIHRLAFRPISFVFEEKFKL
jgi:hypothetical protein